MDKITIERETVQAALRALDYLGDSSDYNVTPFAWQAAEAGQACTALRAALAAQPADAPTMQPLPDHDNHHNALKCPYCNPRGLKFAEPAQPAEPVARVRIHMTGGNAGIAWSAVPTDDAPLMRDGDLLYLAAPPSAAVPPDGMDTVAIKYAHKMALDLECILAEYGGSWYNTAMQTLGEYRSEMNAIHERECPTFMGEPVIAAAGDKP